MLRLTPVVRNLIFINVAVFVLQRMSSGVLTDYLALSHINTPDFRPYQLFTYMFAHAGFGHIFFNMLGLVFFGPILEEFWGQRKFVIFYTVCGVGAGIFNILIDQFVGRMSFGTMIGASGAVYGIMTAFGVTFPNMEMRLLFFPVSFKAKYFVMALGAMAIYSSVVVDPNDNTANLAHLGGIVVALILLQVWKGRDS